MKKNINNIPLASLIADGEVHFHTVDNDIYIYCLSVEPTIMFSYGLLKEEKVEHWYLTKTFTSPLQWLSYYKALLRENLVKRKILTARRSRINLNSKLALLDKINRMQNN